jgi:hypothetical protein
MADNGSPELFQWEDDNGTLHAVSCGIVVSHDDERSAEITSHPVEKGSDINDHVIHQPDRLSLELAQTQTPLPTQARPGPWKPPENFTQKTIKLDVRKSLFKPGGLLAASQAVGNAIGSLLGTVGPEPEISVFVWSADTPRDRIGELHDQLIDVKQKSRFVTVTFRGRMYPGYILTKVRWSSTKGEVGVGRFHLELQSIRIVQNAVAELPDPASLRLKPKKNQAKPPKPVENPAPDASKDRLESNLSRVTGAGAL